MPALRRSGVRSPWLPGPPPSPNLDPLRPPLRVVAPAPAPPGALVVWVGRVPRDAPAPPDRPPPPVRVSAGGSGPALPPLAVLVPARAGLAAQLVWPRPPRVAAPPPTLVPLPDASFLVPLDRARWFVDRDATAYAVPLDRARWLVDRDATAYAVPLDRTVFLVSTPMAVATHVKDPLAIRDYQLDWSTYLAGADTISSASWSVSPSGPTIVTSSNTTTTTTARVSGGTAGTEYTLTCHVVLASGQEDDRSITIQIQDQ